MAFNPFIGKTLPELNAIIADLQDSLASTVMSASSGAVSSQNLTQSADIQRRLEWAFKARTALDPVSYPASAYERVTRTKPDWSLAGF